MKTHRGVSSQIFRDGERERERERERKRKREGGRKNRECADD